MMLSSSINTEQSFPQVYPKSSEKNVKWQSESDFLNYLIHEAILL